MEDKERHLLLMGVHDFGDPAYTVVEMKVTTFLPEDTLVEMGGRLCQFCLACIRHKPEVQVLLDRLEPGWNKKAPGGKDKEDSNASTEPRAVGGTNR